MGRLHKIPHLAVDLVMTCCVVYFAMVQFLFLFTANSGPQFSRQPHLDTVLRFLFLGFAVSPVAVVYRRLLVAASHLQAGVRSSWVWLGRIALLVLALVFGMGVFAGALVVVSLIMFLLMFLIFDSQPGPIIISAMPALPLVAAIVISLWGCKHDRSRWRKVAYVLLILCSFCQLLLIVVPAALYLFAGESLSHEQNLFLYDYWLLNQNLATPGHLIFLVAASVQIVIMSALAFGGENPSEQKLEENVA
jgi:hypothetical protein